MTNDELILTTILNCERKDLYLRPLELSDQERHRYWKMKDRYRNGEPLQYILGQWDFMDTMLCVNPHVLIPRPETELMVEALLQKLRSVSCSEPLSILDLGTGSGNIAIALAKNLGHCTVTAVDVSLEAINVAKDNAALNNVSQKITFVVDDMAHFLASAKDSQEKYHAIVSNPPYIPTRSLAALPSKVRREPRIALDGGTDGLDYYRVIIPAATNVLKNNGVLFCEFGDGQRSGIEEALRINHRFGNIRFEKDYTQTDRFFSAQVI